MLVEFNGVFVMLNFYFCHEKLSIVTTYNIKKKNGSYPTI